jgi:hypothetical protein
VLVPKRGEDPAVFFCWQHKDQAEDLIDGAEKVEIKERSSLETVLQGLGLEEVKEEDEEEKASVVKDKLRERERQRRAAGQVRIQETRKHGKGGFLAALFSCFTGSEPSSGQSSQNKAPRPRPPQALASPMKTSLADRSRPKIKISEPERTSLPSQQRRRASDSNAYGLSNNSQQPLKAHRASLPTSSLKSSTLRPPLATQPHASSAPNVPHRKPLTPISSHQRQNRASSAPPSSQNLSLLNWTPSLPVSPTDANRLTYAKLLTAMSEPPTAGDSPGYIYMFWQTSLPTSSPESDAASQVAHGTASAGVIQFFESRARRDSSASASRTSLGNGRGTGSPKTVFLKIGRAANVMRRMTQWRNQCGYNISLLRYWPQPVREAKAAGLRNKYVGKVEKLVHLNLEMLGLRVKRECRCGTEHREWFEVQAKAAAVREVDNVIGNWVRWCEERYGQDDGQDDGDDDD